MSPSKIDHVDAVFGGRSVRFRLAPDDIPSFEALIQGSAYQCFTKFAGGFWTFADVEAVLRYALPADLGDDNAVMVALERKAAALGMGMPSRKRSDFVSRVLVSRPPAIYAVLASRILEAALFGIEAELAAFDENAASAEEAA